MFLFFFSSSFVVSLCRFVPGVLFYLGLVGVCGFVPCSYSSSPSFAMGLCGFVLGICFLFGFGWFGERRTKEEQFSQRTRKELECLKLKFHMDFKSTSTLPTHRT